MSHRVVYHGNALSVSSENNPWEALKTMDKEQLQVRGWGLIVLLLAAAEIFFEYSGNRKGVFITKPLTMMLIMIQPALIGLGLVNDYQKTILLGMMASITGDVFLMLPSKYFTLGLGAFFVAHVIYIYGFFHDREGSINVKTSIPFLAAGAALYTVLAVFGRLEGVMYAYVGAYTLVISAMAWLAWDRRNSLYNGRRQMAGFAAYGAVLFMVSDATLGISKFIGTFEGANMLIMATYFGAQYLIARSAFRFPRKRF
jgi:uncharacterized membrane protein YhhN